MMRYIKLLSFLTNILHSLKHQSTRKHLLQSIFFFLRLAFPCISKSFRLDKNKIHTTNLQWN